MGLTRITKRSECKWKRKGAKDKAQRGGISKGDLEGAATKVGEKQKVYLPQERGAESCVLCYVHCPN